MTTQSTKEEWKKYCESELLSGTPLLHTLGFELEENQPHIQGERYMMSGRKLVLLGRRISDKKRVVIKLSSNDNGKEEIEHEHKCRTTILKIRFAYRLFHSPEEILFSKKNGVTIYISEYIEQPHPFLSLPFSEQFSLALDSFKTQESIHAATSGQTKTIKTIFGMWDAEKYLRTFASAEACTSLRDSENIELRATLEETATLLRSHKDDIERYCGFLTHEDFALHNFRIYDGRIYLIDHASLRFGSKHESWARFMNFMLLYNRDLEISLTKYMDDNRSPEENTSLHLMRMYKLGELISYHSRAYAEGEGAFAELSKARVQFWGDVLSHHLKSETVPDTLINDYKTTRDRLRSDEEKQRQKELQQLIPD